MILLYTGAEKPNFPQKSPELSLGGWISNTTIPNSFLNNLFGLIGKDDLQNKTFEVRCIALKNITGAAITNAAIYTVTPDTSLTTIQFACVIPNIDPTCNAPYLEQIMNGECMPYYADFQSYEGVDNAFILPNIDNAAIVGIWMLRQVSDVGAAAVANQTCADLAAAFAATDTSPQPTEDIIQFIIDWTVPAP